MTKFISNSLEETQKMANDFVGSIVPQEDRATVVGLYGNLGAGKTTFTQCVARVFGVSETITSPTFVIEKIYPIRIYGRERPTSNGASEHKHNFSHLIHIDAYRLEKSEELLHLGWKEIISDSNNLILIEWPERVSDIMPEHIRVNFKTLDEENSREIEVV